MAFLSSPGSDPNVDRKPFPDVENSPPPHRSSAFETSDDSSATPSSSSSSSASSSKPFSFPLTPGLRCDVVGPPSLEGLLTIATPNLLNYGRKGGEDVSDSGEQGALPSQRTEDSPVRPPLSRGPDKSSVDDSSSILATSTSLSNGNLPKTSTASTESPVVPTFTEASVKKACSSEPLASPFRATNIPPSSLFLFSQHRQAAPHPSRVAPRRDLRLDFASGSHSLKRCNSAPVIDQSPLIFPNGSPGYATTAASDSTSVRGMVVPVTEAGFQQQLPFSNAGYPPNHSPSLPLPSPTRRASLNSSSVFKPISSMSPSGSLDGHSEEARRRFRRLSSTSSLGGRSTSPYTLPRTPSRLEQILNDELCNPTAREEAEERETNEVQSISSSCDKLDLVGIEESSSSFPTNAFFGGGAPGVSNGSPAVNSGRGLGAAFGLDFAAATSLIASVGAAANSVNGASSPTTRQSPLLTQQRIRTISDSNGNSTAHVSPLPPGAFLSTPASSLSSLSINMAGVNSPAASVNCSPSPTGSGTGPGISSNKQCFSPRRQACLPASPVLNRRSLSPLANAGHAGIKRKIYCADLALGGGGSDSDQPAFKFSRSSFSRGSTPERSLPTPTASPGLSPRAPLPPLVGGSTSGAAAAPTSSTHNPVSLSSLPASPSTPLPPSPSVLASNPFSRPTSPQQQQQQQGGATTKSRANATSSPWSALREEGATPRPSGVASVASSISSDSSFSSLDESVNFSSSSTPASVTGFSDAAASREASSSSPPPTSGIWASVREKSRGVGPTGFRWSKTGSGTSVENVADEAVDSKPNSAELGENLAPMETDLA